MYKTSQNARVKIHICKQSRSKHKCEDLRANTIASSPELKEIASTRELDTMATTRDMVCKLSRGECLPKLLRSVGSREFAVLQKYKDESIREEWKADALEHVISINDAERKLNGIEVFCFDGMWQSDSLIPNDIRSAFISSLRPLEDLPESGKDWDLRSDHQVLNLVDPSLYPILYKHTRAYPRSIPAEERNWWNIQELILPWCPIGDTDSNGKSCKIASYINNLDPKKYPAAYKALEDIFPRFVPMFERLLRDSSLADITSRRVPDRHLGPSSGEEEAGEDEMDIDEEEKQEEDEGMMEEQEGDNEREEKDEAQDDDDGAEKEKEQDDANGEEKEEEQDDHDERRRRKKEVLH
ncbi:hypothetical protein BT69DRAFT_1325001 [Atractiella rhizophila]|nr:hypothetical protein BT69DRAFT_1325001 [Atractiella rhizophila]